MALSYIDTDGTLVIPQANAKWTTASSNSGIATSGVVVLVGEAEQGPAYSAETDLTQNFFGPNQLAQVQAKYGSGRLVDAFNIASNPSKDPGVRGSPTSIYLVKTNSGTKASALMPSISQTVTLGANLTAGDYLTITVGGASVNITAKNSGAGAGEFNITGTGASDVLTIGGGADTAFGAGKTITFNVGGGPVVLTEGVDFAAGGDDQASATAIQNAINASVSLNTKVVAVAALGGALADSTVTVTAINKGTYGNAFTAATNDGVATWASATFSPGSINTTATATSMASAITTYGLAPLLYTSATANLAVVTVSSQQAFALVASGVNMTVGGSQSSYAQVEAKLAGLPGNVIYFTVSTPVVGKRTITVTRQNDSKTESFTVGGNVALTCKSASAANFVVGSTTITSSGNSPSVAALSILKSQYATLGDLAAFINSQTGWTATVLPAFKQMSPSVLDQDTVADASAGSGAEIKKDAYEYNTAISNSGLIEGKGTAPVTGLPDDTVLPMFLSSGAKGTTTDANFVSALAAVEQLRCNAVVTLVSQDATTDFAAGLTESGSTYTVAGVNTALTDHVSRMSQFKRRRPRQAYASFRGSFANAKTAAQTQAFFRTSMAFQDVLALSTSGGVTWFQPWMGATLAAGMQMAAFYKPIFNKSIAASGVVQNAADFTAADDTQVEDALLAGLLVIRQREDGSYAFVSDQTTYSVDQNFVYNSIQAIYVADTISTTVATRMEKAFVGQSFADVTASVALSYLKAIFADLKRLKLIAASDDAIDGYKNAKVEISAPSMRVSAEVKEATGLYFIPISFLITQVQQTATG
jgi:hypothetical protein